MTNVITSKLQIEGGGGGKAFVITTLEIKK